MEEAVGGTAPYSAPEVLLGKDLDIGASLSLPYSLLEGLCCSFGLIFGGVCLDVGCDVFSMGVIIWEMFTRSRPWDGTHAARISQLVGFEDKRLEMSEQVEALPEIKAIIEECWLLKSSARPKFASLMDKLDAADAGA